MKKEILTKTPRCGKNVLSSAAAKFLSLRFPDRVSYHRKKYIQIPSAVHLKLTLYDFYEDYNKLGLCFFVLNAATHFWT